MNDTRVVPARIAIEQPRGEVLLLEQIDGDVWEALARPTRRLRAGARYGSVELLEHLGEGRWRVRLDGEPAGARPLPPYITSRSPTRSATRRSMRASTGSAAAPTAGLHFTPEVLARLDVERVTLHVGLDTFRPLQAERSRSTASTASGTRSRRTRGSGSAPRERVLAVGTTTVRVLETLAARRAARRAAPSSSSRRASSSAASTTC